MDIQQTINNLNSSRTLIADYAELDANIWHHQFQAKFYNRKRLFNMIALGAGAVMILILSSGPGPNIPFDMMIFSIPMVYLFVRYAIGGPLDYFKRRRIKQEAIPQIQRLSEEMNSIAEKLNSFSVLPEKYRSLHAVNTIGGYLINQRADSLKEAINLYEDELFKYKQLQNQQFQIHQNNQIMQQNKEMIRAQKVTNSRLLWQ